MENLEVSFHNHPLLSFTRFVNGICKGCKVAGYIYGGYCCNELGCSTVFHKECGEALPEINHYSHPDHPLKLFNRGDNYSCSLCGRLGSHFGYSCSVCDFKLDLDCATRGAPLPILVNLSVHEHPLELSHDSKFASTRDCKACNYPDFGNPNKYVCIQCELFFHVECVTYLPEAYHTSHPKHSLKFLVNEAAPSYAEKKCILCGEGLDKQILHHCDVCNFNICRQCMKNPLPVCVVSLTTHEHQLHLAPRHIKFTCDACGMTGERSPYFCRQCNFMIHWECIDLPRVININRHDHCVSYTRHLGQG